MKLLAKALGMPKSSITLAAGAKSKSKTLAVGGLSSGDIIARLMR